jgi:hypothetical protein
MSSPAQTGDPDPAALRDLDSRGEPGHDELERVCVNVEAKLLSWRRAQFVR